MKFVLNGKTFKLVFDMSKINTRKKNLNAHIQII